MLIILISVALILSMIFFGISLFNVLTAPLLKRIGSLNHHPKISILIPARNEADRIGRCLASLAVQDYPNFEIIVLDDESSDGTATNVQQYIEHDARIHLVAGKPLPAGWTGKNWACHQLSQVARGEIFIFTDADVQLAPNALSGTMFWMKKLGLGFLSAFPQQITGSWGEKLVVPLIEIFALASLPLWATYWGRSALLAAAIGQWMVFTRRAYHQTGGHAAVRAKIVEDVELSRLAKENEVKTLMAMGTNVLFCRMYHSTSAVWAGYSKNMFGIFGYHHPLFFMILLSMLLTGVLPYFLVFIPGFQGWAVSVIGINVMMRGFLALRFRHPFWVSTILHPVGILFTVLIGINSIMVFHRGVIAWKEREVQMQNGD